MQFANEPDIYDLFLYSSMKIEKIRVAEEFWRSEKK